MTFGSVGGYLITSGSPEVEPGSDEMQNAAGDPNVPLLLWLRNWPAAFAA
jgi:hypothetical protein